MAIRYLMSQWITINLIASGHLYQTMMVSRCVYIILRQKNSILVTLVLGTSPVIQGNWTVWIRGIGQGHVHYKASLIIIILNVVLLQCILTMIYHTQTIVYNCFIITIGKKMRPPYASIATSLFLYNGTAFPTKSHLILKHTE